MIAVDQATKAVVSDVLGRRADSHRSELLGSLLAFEYVENTGAAFGVLKGQGIILTVIAAAVVVLLIWRYLRGGRSSPLIAVSVGLLVGGALGNVIDRIRLGYVVDFVAVGTFPRFNAADSAVTIGVLLLAWSMSREEPNSEDARAVSPIRTDAHAAHVTRSLEGG